MIAKLVTENVKGYNAYSVVLEDGTVIAKSHCVQVKMGRYSVQINGRFAGVRTEAGALKALNEVIAIAAQHSK